MTIFARMTSDDPAFSAHRSLQIRHLVFMEFRTLGRSGFEGAGAEFGTGTFGGGNEFF